jgi:CBS domain-containing protein
VNIQEHARHTWELHKLRAEDLHKWIDGYFDVDSFQAFLQGHETENYDPYDHRKHRHCREALSQAQQEFKNIYSAEQVKKVFDTHLMDDYQGYIPQRQDFDNPDFRAKYHNRPEPSVPIEENIFTPEELTQYFDQYYGKKIKTPKDRGFIWRIVLPSLATAALFIAFIFWIILPTIEIVLLDKKKEMIKELAHTAASVINYYIDLEQQGQLSLQQAQDESIRELQKMRYGPMGKDYFWIIDYHPTMLMHPYRPELIGRDLREYRDREDKSGKFLFNEAVNLVKSQGGGYLRYRWQWMDDENTSVSKLSYVMDIPSWNWILGTGIYINDIEEELQRIEGKISWISLGLTWLLLLILSFVIWQSRRIEDSRQRAERGLREAKERYRSLVERSNEAHMMILQDRVVYSNLALQRLLDMDPSEMKQKPLEEILQPYPGETHQEQKQRRDILNLIAENKDLPRQFTLRLKSPSGTMLFLEFQASRLFFKDSNGYLLSIRPMENLQWGLENKSDDSHSNDSLHQEMLNSKTVNHSIYCLNRLSQKLYNREDFWQNPDKSRRDIAVIYKDFLKTLIELYHQGSEINKEDFCFISLGSSARGEITFYSDQDNALVWKDNSMNSKSKLQLDDLAGSVCKTLNQAGFAYCPGGIMAVNPQWNQDLSTWKKQIKHWIKNPDNRAFQQISVLADMQAAWGIAQVVDQLKQELERHISTHKDFLNSYARHCLEYTLPLNSLGQLHCVKIEGERSLDLKECLKALEVALRLLAMQHGIACISTEEWLRALTEKKGGIKNESQEKLLKAFNHLWSLRFKVQVQSISQIKKVSDNINPDKMTPEDRESLIQSLKAIQALQWKIRYDFFGGQ